jgi:hypothetical protein
MPDDGNPFPLLVNRRKRLTIFAGVAPPRLFIAAQQMPDLDDERQRQRESISDEDAGKLVAGDGNWACLDVRAAVAYLVDSWCERRCLSPLGRVLQAWPTNGLSDGAHELLGALRLARAVAIDVVTRFESELLSAVESKLSGQLGADCAFLAAIED